MMDQTHIVSARTSIAAALEGHGRIWGENDDRSIIASQLGRSLVGDDAGEALTKLDIFAIDDFAEAGALHRTATSLRDVAAMLSTHQERCETVASFLSGPEAMRNDQAASEAEGTLSAQLSSLLMESAAVLDDQADGLSAASQSAP